MVLRSYDNMIIVLLGSYSIVISSFNARNTGVLVIRCQCLMNRVINNDVQKDLYVAGHLWK